MGKQEINMVIARSICAIFCVLVVSSYALSSNEGAKTLEALDPVEVPLAGPGAEDCDTLTNSLPALCKMFGEDQCNAMRAKITANCEGALSQDDDLGEDMEDDNEENLGESQQETQQVELSRFATLGGRRGGLDAALVTMGSFTMIAARGGAGEELGEDDEEEDTTQDWDTTGEGKCDANKEAWLATDAKDKASGRCVEFAADTKCGAQCYHQGTSVDETVDQAVCSKICQVPGNNGAHCNVIKTVQPTDDGMYLTRSKVTQADLKDPANADPMACALGR